VTDTSFALESRVKSHELNGCHALLAKFLIVACRMHYKVLYLSMMVYTSLSMLSPVQYVYISGRTLNNIVASKYGAQGK